MIRQTKMINELDVVEEIVEEINIYGNGETIWETGNHMVMKIKR